MVAEVIAHDFTGSLIRPLKMNRFDEFKGIRNPKYLPNDLFLFFFFTPPRNRGGVIFSLQFVSVCVCLSVCPALLVNKIPAERMHRFGRNFS